ncbi:SOS response-associated peptidase [Benzoatithermus flavus]|uniref:Abasic site processing protein n=1 Tax=Benzoatithermus flavus TaxID=3108223 RepID=A0ABU8XNC4_9PROT
MCGRFALSIVPAEFERVFGCAPPEGIVDRWNIAPDSAIVVVRAGEGGVPEAAFVRWGLLGPWAKEANDPGRQINARVETAASKPMLRDAFRRGRCLIPASGFYEWQKKGSGPAQPFFIGLESGEPFAFAGLWRANRLADGSVLETCTILTTAASLLLKPIHHRMPVILPTASHALWLDPTVKDTGLLEALLIPRPDSELAVRAVGRAVNNPRNEGPSLAEPLGQREERAPEPGPAQGSLW